MMVDLMNWLVLPLISLSAILCVVRLVRGPSLADRVIAFDLLATLGIALLAAYAVATSEKAYFDVGLLLALLSFLGTVAFAHYMERSRR